MRFHHVLFAAVLAAPAGIFAPSVADADIIGFGNFSGFTVNQDDSGSPPTVSTGLINLTQGNSEFRSIFYDTPQNISGFTASFTYQASQQFNAAADPGACFVLQDSPSGASAVDTGTFAYGGMAGKSLGITFELINNASGYYTNGNVNSGSPSTNPVDLLSGDPINVALTYNGSTLQESLLDTTTHAEYSTSYLVLTPLPTLLGGSTAYVGLTADSSYNGDNQTFSSFQFTTLAVPEPSTLALLGVGATALFGYAWRRSRRFERLASAR